MQVEKGEHFVDNTTPTGVRYVDNNGQPFQAIYREPVVAGGAFLTTGLFITDAITVGPRTTMNAGLRFDHTRAFSQDLYPRDGTGRETGSVDCRRGHDVHVERLLSAPGRHDEAHCGCADDPEGQLRAVSSGRAERRAAAVSPGCHANHHEGVRARDRRLHPRFLRRRSEDQSAAGSGDRSPRTDEYSVSVERELARGVTVASAYVYKDGRDFTGWTDAAGQYREELRTLPDGRTAPVFVLVSPANDRRFLMTNPDDYSLKYNGVVMSVDARGSAKWRAFASYTLSRTHGPAALERRARRRRPDQQCDRPVRVRPRSEQPDQRARPAAERSTAHGSRDGDRGRPANESDGRGQSSVLQRDALDVERADCAPDAAGRPARAARAARLETVAGPDAARRSRLEADPHWRRPAHRAALRTCSMCSTARPPKVWRRTICSARTSESRPSSSIPGAS